MNRKWNSLLIVVVLAISVLGTSQTTKAQDALPIVPRAGNGQALPENENFGCPIQAIELPVGKPGDILKFYCRTDDNVLAALPFAFTGCGQTFNVQAVGDLYTIYHLESFGGDSWLYSQSEYISIGVDQRAGKAYYLIINRQTSLATGGLKVTAIVRLTDNLNAKLATLNIGVISSSTDAKPPVVVPLKDKCPDNSTSV